MGWPMSVEQTVTQRKIDRLIHQPTRLRIMHALLQQDLVEFTALKKSLGTTAGNLTTHLSRLENAGYLQSEKTIEEKQIRTRYWLTMKGIDRFEQYQQAVQPLITEPEGGQCVYENPVIETSHSQCLEAHRR